jgi:hypothetical protein
MQDVHQTTKLSSRKTFSTINYQFSYQIRNLICTGTLLIIRVKQKALFNCITKREVSVKSGTVTTCRLFSKQQLIVLHTLLLQNRCLKQHALFKSLFLQLITRPVETQHICLSMTWNFNDTSSEELGVTFKCTQN